MQRTTIDFGIDLGTTNSTIAVVEGTDARVIPNKVGSGITPSAVWIDKRGVLHVGQEAKERALVTDHENGDLEFKLRMGRGSEGRKVFVRSAREMLPEELSAEVLKSLKMDVQTNMGEQVRAVVITVPAAFELPQTQATQKAAQLAGFALSPLLPEPVAASLAYGFQTESENAYWMVYDFGGGTFDAAVMRVRDGLIQVVNHDGNNYLGGKLIDWDIVTKKLFPVITQQFNLPEFTRGNPKWSSAIGKMKYYAELAKIEVCRTKAPYEVFVEGLCVDADGKSVDLLYTLTPDDVEQVGRPYIEQSLGLCRKTLKDKGLTGSNLERVLMVGGTTLNPWVRAAVQAELGGKLEFGIDPVTVVARGAAIYASTLKSIESTESVPTGTWRIQIEHEPVGNSTDPDIGGRVLPPGGENPKGFTIEFVETRGKWHSGRITLGADGVFMTQLVAEAKGRYEYNIELCDATGTRIPTSPDRVAYTFAPVVPDKAPALHTIGVGLANDEMMPYVVKGTKLPARKAPERPHRTTVSLRAGKAEDVLRISLLEGEKTRATRNHGIGFLIIRGSDIRRDLPMGSEVEVTVMMDESQQVRLQAYIPTLDEDFELRVDLKMEQDSLEALHKKVEQQKARLAKARQESKRTGERKAEAALTHIDSEQILDQVDSLMEAAKQDEEAHSQLDRRLRDLTAAIDEVEDSVEWPVLVENAEAARKDAAKLVEQFGESDDRNRLKMLEGELKRATEAGDPDLLRQCRDELDGLWYQVANRQLGYHIGRFENLTGRLKSMKDPAQAEQLIAQGRRAINNNDIDALKAANRQLLALLPGPDQSQVDERISDLF